MGDAKTVPTGVSVPVRENPRKKGKKSAPSVDEQVLDQLTGLRREVPGVVSSLVATSDGLLVGQDSDLEGAQLAALTSTLAALSRHCVETTRGGELLDAVVRGTNGYLAVFAIGDTAVLAVVADPEVTPAWLHLRTRPVVERLAALAQHFDRFYTGAPDTSTASAG